MAGAIAQIRVTCNRYSSGVLHVHLIPRYAAACSLASERMRSKAQSKDKAQTAKARTQPNPPGIDYRSKPELYKIARGEQGVLTVQPYKGGRA